MRRSYQGSNNPNWQGGKPHCVDCGRKVSNYHNKRCRSCANKQSKGKGNPNWRGGKTVSFCKDCGKRVSKYSKRCKSCSRKGENSWSRKNGKPKCIDCGKPLLSYNSNVKRHQSCWYKFAVGENSPGWKGGVNPLWSDIRRCDKYLEWVKQVYKKDSYTCQNCGQLGKDLHAHHLKPFKEILAEFLEKYNQFSPIEDKETLVRLSWSYEPFWDVSNGKTFCKVCHNEIPKVRT